MSTSPTVAHDVIIAGAGPVGLFLACELQLAGCSVLVLEKMPDPDSPMKRAPFGLRGLSIPTLESFARRGLLNEMQECAVGRDTPGTAHWMKQERRPAGHFAGIQFFYDQVDSASWPYRLPGHVSNLAAEMASIEVVLAARAEVLGATIVRGFSVDDLEQSDEGVAVQAGGRMFLGRWLIGCDGARSMVRKAAGIDFAGTEPEFTGYSVKAELADLDMLKPGRHLTADGMYMFTPPGTVGMADFDGGVFHRSAAITRDHVENVLRKISGADVRVTKLELAATWTDRAYQATEYRKGRVLLAGDAAHIHSPLGGQGLNLGLGDAMNLGWKQAAVIRGHAPTDLLDSYARERMPVGASVLDWSRAQVALMRPNRSSRALEAIVRDLIATRDGATYFAERVWGASLRYDLNGGHPLEGRGLPNFELNNETRVGALMRDGKGLLLDFDHDPSTEALTNLWSDRVSYVADVPRDKLGLSAVLVRPDGIVAWASDTATDTTTLTQALARWFGEPTQAG